MNIVYLLLGTNLGSRKINIEIALKHIRLNIGEIINKSSIYETEPWGFKNQPTFLNQAVCIKTNNSVDDVFRLTRNIETRIGRTKSQKWHARKIDIDILFFNDTVFKKEGLIIPHAELHNRKFTLIPLSEIAPKFIHPVLNNSIAKLLEVCNDSSQVEVYSE